MPVLQYLEEIYLYTIHITIHIAQSDIWIIICVRVIHDTIHDIDKYATPESSAALQHVYMR